MTQKPLKLRNEKKYVQLRQKNKQAFIQGHRNIHL